MECRTGEAMLNTHRIDRNTHRPDFEPIRLGSELAGRHADDDHAGSGNLPVHKPFVSHLDRREKQARNRKEFHSPVVTLGRTISLRSRGPS